MDAQYQRCIFVETEAPALNKRVGDIVRSGEIVGQYQQRDVKIPFDAIIENIFCDGNTHVASLTLVSLRLSATPGLLSA